MAGLKPHLNISTGEFIAEELESRNWTQEDLAEIMGVAPKTISHLIAGKGESLTLEMARRLAQAFGQSPQYWLNIDTNYRLRLQAKESVAEKGIAVRAEIYRYMPVREMVKHGWLPDVGNKVPQLVAAVKAFWRRETLDFGFMDAATLPHCRTSAAHAREFNPYFAYTWYHVARKQAETMQFPAPWNRAKVEALAQRMPEFTLLTDGVSRFIHELNAAGVGFVQLRHLQKTYLDGAAFLVGERPFVVYTKRFDRLDNFWFTMAHELGHVLQHLGSGEEYFLDSFDGDTKDDREETANRFAEQCLKAEEIRSWGKAKNGRISESDACLFARQLGMDPSVVVGCLQHAKLLSNRYLNRLKKPVSDALGR